MTDPEGPDRSPASEPNDPSGRSAPQERAAVRSARLARPVRQAVLAPLVLLLAFSLLVVWQTQQLLDLNRWADHTEDVIAQCRVVQLKHFEAAAEMRGYLLTRDQQVYRDFVGKTSELEGSIVAIQRLVADSEAQLERTKETLRLSAQWRDFAHDLVRDFRRSTGPADPSRVIAGKQNLDRLSRNLGDLIQRENELQSKRTAEVQQAGRLIAIGGISLAVLLGVLLAYIAFRSIGIVASEYEVALEERERAQQALRESHEQLEERVAARTHELRLVNADLEQQIAVRREAEAQLRATTEMLQRSNRELEDFAYVASHDLQEPLRKIRAFSDRLVARFDGALPPEGRDYLARMTNAAGRMQSLIQDLLEFSRVTTRPRPFEPVDLTEIVRGVESDLEARVEETQGELLVRALPKIEADPAQMRRLFQNLVANGLKFQQPGVPPRVEITAFTIQFRPLNSDEPEEGVEVRVRDNGIGFDERYLDRIFAPFQRLHGRNEYEGTGIGLAVCRKIVERHRGELTATSAPGKGSTFIVRLPTTQPRITEPAPVVGAVPPETNPDDTKPDHAPELESST